MKVGILSKRAGGRSFRVPRCSGASRAGSSARSPGSREKTALRVVPRISPVPHREVLGALHPLPRHGGPGGIGARDAPRDFDRAAGGANTRDTGDFLFSCFPFLYLSLF